MNETLQQIHNMLLTQHTALSKELEDVTDPAAAKTILTEMQEILHRIDLVQGLLFRESSQALDKTLDKINEANEELAKAIKSVEDVAGFLKSTSDFLRLVDKAIDIAKTLAVVA